MDANDNFLSKNIKAWDKRTNIHICSDFYNMDKFRANKSSLNSIELEGIGSIANKSLLLSMRNTLLICLLSIFLINSENEYASPKLGE